MKFSTTTFIGILFLFLNSSPSFASTSYLFGGEQCSTLNGAKLSPKGKNCPTKELVYSLKDSLHLFCQYRLQAGDSLKKALTKNQFYRSKIKAQVIPFMTGRPSRVINSRINYLLLSRRDLLSTRPNLCQRVNPQTLAVSAFAFHIPNSLYALKSGLKKIGQPQPTKQIIYNKGVQKPVENSDVKKETPLRPPSSTISKTSFELKTSLFFERFKGRQISNGTTAEISSKLSPGLRLSYNIREHKKFRYSFFAGIDFHIFNEKADQLTIANSNVQSIEIGSFVKLVHFKYFSPKLGFSLFEDLYYTRQSSSSIGFERELVPRLSLAATFNFYKDAELSVFIEPTLLYDFSQGNLEAGFGYQAPLSVKISKDAYFWKLNLDYKSVKKDLSDLELEHSFISISANLGIKF